MKQLILGIFIFVATAGLMRPADYAGRYRGDYRWSVERIPYNGQFYPGGLYTGAKVDATVRKNNRISILAKGSLRFNGRPIGQKFDENFVGKVTKSGRIRLSRGGFTRAGIQTLFGPSVMIRNQATIRGNRLSIKVIIQTQRFGLVNASIVANR